MTSLSDKMVSFRKLLNRRVPGRQGQKGGLSSEQGMRAKKEASCRGKSKGPRMLGTEAESIEMAMFARQIQWKEGYFGQKEPRLGLSGRVCASNSKGPDD